MDVHTPHVVTGVFKYTPRCYLISVLHATVFVRVLSDKVVRVNVIQMLGMFLNPVSRKWLDLKV